MLGVPEERVRVVPNGVGQPFVADGDRAEGEYVLAVGTVEPRKNLPRLAQATRAAGLELRVAGARGWGDVRVNGDGDGVRFLGFVPDEELAALYRGALCFTYPSLYEGFGIPVLEALACGAPVVTSSGTAMAEVADGAAVLASVEAEPHDPAPVELAERRVDRVAAMPEDGRRRRGLDHPVGGARISVALWPPKPNEFDITTSTWASRDWLGTTSRSQSGSGFS